MAAGSRRRGMWSGGMPLLGYTVEKTKLVVDEIEAAYQSWPNDSTSTERGSFPAVLFGRDLQYLLRRQPDGRVVWGPIRWLGSNRRCNK